MNINFNIDQVTHLDVVLYGNGSLFKYHVFFSNDSSIIIEEDDYYKLRKYFKSKARRLLKSGLELTFDEKLKSGFKIGPKDGSYKRSFTDKDFENFFMSYLRPRTIELLYGKGE